MDEWKAPRRGRRSSLSPTYEGRDPMYIGIGTILLIILIVLLIAFVF
jgi:hypothetical protein